jgi:hypothetical protein
MIYFEKIDRVKFFELYNQMDTEGCKELLEQSGAYMFCRVCSVKFQEIREIAIKYNKWLQNNRL